MADTKVEIVENRFGRTVVIVGGKIAYESANPIPIEKKNIKRLLRMLDGIEVEDLKESEDSPEPGNTGSNKPN